MRKYYSKWIKIDNLYFPTNEDGDVYKDCSGFTVVKDYCNGLAEVSDGEKWGCINCFGELIISIQYDCIEIRKEKDNQYYINCGRNGQFFTGQNGNKTGAELETIYTGVYDLYDIDGHLLFGGFDEYKYNDIVNLFFFFIGRIWHLDKTYYWSHYSIINNYGKWIVLTHDLDFVTDVCCYNSRYYGKGHVVNPHIVNFIHVAGQAFPEQIAGGMNWEERSGGKSLLLVDLPGDVIFDDVKVLNSNQLLCKNSGKYSLIWIKQRKRSKEYSYILSINDEYAFVLNSKIGLVRYGEETIPCEYSIITKPINGWSFVFANYPYFPNSEKGDKFYIRIVDARKICSHKWEMKYAMLVAENVEKKIVEADLHKGYYRLLPSKNDIVEEHDLKEVSLTEKATYLFCDDFLKQLDNPLKKVITSFEDKYWYTDIELRKKKDSSKMSRDLSPNDYSLMDALDGEPDAYWNID